MPAQSRKVKVRAARWTLREIVAAGNDRPGFHLETDSRQEAKDYVANVLNIGVTWKDNAVANSSRGYLSESDSQPKYVIIPHVVTK